MDKVTAGHEVLGDFAPEFAHFNDDVLFGEVWARERQLAPRDRSLVTVSALLASGVLDASLGFHIRKAKENGVTREEMVEALTQLAFYAGWPKAWAAFRMAKEIYADGGESSFDPLFGRGRENTAYAKYFIGKSYLNPLVKDGLGVANVTFEPGCRNNWHIHHGGGQILLVTDGRGWYQEWGKPARALSAGDAVSIPPEVKHWHGAAGDSWFAHVAIAVPAEGASSEWLEPVTEEDYRKL